MKPAAGTRARYYRGWMLVVLAWLLVYPTRPLILGFCGDDWPALLRITVDTAPFSAGRFAFFMELFANRPVYGAATFALSAICDDSPRLWHAAIAVLALASGLVLRMFLRSVLRLSGHGGASLAADVAASIWLLMPWMLGITAWAILGPSLIAVMLFALAGRSLFEGWRRGQTPWLGPALLMLACLLTYEAFYGQFLTLLLIGLVAGVTRQIGAKRLLPVTFAFVAAQALALTWNRVVPLFNSMAPTKSFSSAWTAKLTHSLTSLPYLFSYSASETSPIPELLLAALLTLCAAAVLARFFSHDQRAGALRQVGLLALCGVGTLIALLVLAVAGYGINWVGQSSRCSLGFSFWLATGLAIGLAAVANRPVAWRCAAGTLSLGLGVLMAVATHARLAEWSEVWAIQRSTIATAPVADLRSAPPDSVVLLTGPHRHKGLTVFAYSWDINGIMKCHFPDLENLRFLPARDDYVTTWDGHVLTQRKQTGGKLICQVEASDVLVWANGENRAHAVASPFQHPPAGGDVRVAEGATP